MAALFVIAALGLLAEKTRVGAHLTGAVVVILLTIAAANFGVIPHTALAYDFVFSYFVPVLIPLFLFKADLRRIFFETTRTTMAFLLASIGTVTGAVVAVLLLDLGTLAHDALADPTVRDGAVAGLFTSTYIGGSVNYAALGEITGLRADASFFSAATATDNLFSAIYLAFLALMPGWAWLSRRFNDRDHSKEEAYENDQHPTALTLVSALALALVIVAAGDWLTAMLSAPTWRYALITVLALACATAFPSLMARLDGAFDLGIGLAFVFFAAIAAGADVTAMIQAAPMLILLVLILLAVHAVLTFGLGWMLKLSLPELITASNAAVLGATTAPALAAAKGWRDLVTPGVLVGVFGYAIGTLVGTALFQFWTDLFG
jgi:uncharacterized membrane protein